MLDFHRCVFKVPHIRRRVACLWKNSIHFLSDGIHNVFFLLNMDMDNYYIYIYIYIISSGQIIAT